MSTYQKPPGGPAGANLAALRANQKGWQQTMTEMLVEETTRECIRCGDEQDIDSFPRNPITGNRNRVCKSCRAKKAQENSRNLEKRECDTCGELKHPCAFRGGHKTTCSKCMKLKGVITYSTIRCDTCDLEKPHRAFYKRADGNGFTSTCRACINDDSGYVVDGKKYCAYRGDCLHAQDLGGPVKLSKLNMDTVCYRCSMRTDREVVLEDDGTAA